MFHADGMAVHLVIWSEALPPIPRRKLTAGEINGPNRPDESR